MANKILLKKVIVEGKETPVDESKTIETLDIDKATFVFEFGQNSFELANGQYKFGGHVVTAVELSEKLATSLEELTSGLKYPYSLQTNGKNIPAEIVVSLARLTELDDDLAELDNKIFGIEGELSSQRQIDEVREQHTQKQTSQKDLEEQIQSVATLAQKMDKIKKELGELEPQLRADRGQIAELREIVIAAIRRTLMQGSKAGRLVTSIVKSMSNMPAWPMAIIIGFIAFLGFVTTITTGSISVMLIAVFFVVLQSALLFLLLRVRETAHIETPIEHLDDSFEELKLIDPNDSQVSSYLARIGESDPSAVFFKSAMVEAYRNEVSELEAIVNSRLEGKNLDELKNLHQNISQELTALEAKVAELDKVQLTPDIYLKKRRELDMLKLERRRKRSAEGQIEGGVLTFVNQLILDMRKYQIVSQPLLQEILGITFTLEGETLLVDGDEVEQLEYAEGLGVFLLKVLSKVSKSIDAEDAMWPLLLSEQLAKQSDMADLREIIVVR